jgi:hypothetical protein
VTFAVRPGHASQWLSLEAMVRQRYEETAKTVEDLIRKREADGIPLDDRADWREDMADILDMVTGASREAARRALEQALGIVSGGLVRLPPYKPDEAQAGVEVRLRALSKADVLDHRAVLAGISDGDTDASRLGAMAARHRASVPFIITALVGIRGARIDGAVLAIDDLAPSDERTAGVVADLDAAGLLGAVYSVCRDYQELSPLAREGFGSPPPSTSASSTAASAPSPADASSDAKADATHPGSRATP